MSEGFEKNNMKKDDSKKSKWPIYYHIQSAEMDLLNNGLHSKKQVDKREEISIKEYGYEFLEEVDEATHFHNLKEYNFQLWRDVHDIKNIFEKCSVDTKEKILKFNERGGHFFCPSAKEIFHTIKNKDSHYFVVRKKKKVIAFIVMVGRHFSTHQDILSEEKTQFESSTIVHKISEMDQRGHLVVFDDLASLESGFTTYFLLINFFKELKARGYKEGIAEVYSLFTEIALNENIMGSIPNVSLKLMHCLAPSYVGYFKERIELVLNPKDSQEQIPLILKRNLYQINIENGLKELQKMMDRHFRMVL